MLKAGDPAPDIELQTDTGEPFRLSDLRGRRVILYFYPKASTPGCTTESCEFRDRAAAFAEKGAAVVGISPDKPAAQAKFKKKYGFPFPLLADQEKAAAQAYGVWTLKNLYGGQVHGHRAQHVCHRPRREDREGLRQGESERPRRRSPGSFVGT
jgi:peroxiredoxin Q/BCP